MQLLGILLALVPAALAVPASAHHHHPKNFTLRSHVLSPPNAAFENLYLEPYHIGPAYNFATLYPKTNRTSGIIGYLNGTKQEIEDEEGDLVFCSGSNFPLGFVIDQVNSTYNPVEINAGAGTKGIFIDQGVIKYHNPLSGGFYACNKTLLYGPAVQVFYKPKVITTPEGCSDVELVVEYR